MTHPNRLPKGGITPPPEIIISPSEGIANAALPARALVPLLQHAGSPARCLVKPGDLVGEGMLIGKADGPVSANVHSPIPGAVVEIRSLELPSGQTSQTVVIDLGGSFERSGRPRARRPWEALSRQDLLERIRDAGVVGLGGGALPTHRKLARAPGDSPPVLIANGIDCEPYLSADDALMREKPADIVEGLRICRALLAPRRIVFVLGEHSDDLAPLFEQMLRGAGVKGEVVVLPSRYPQGHEQLVVSSLEGRPPGQGSPAVVLNVATLHAVFEAVVLEKPLFERVLTVTGSTLARPRNLKVRIGTCIGELIEECGGITARTGKVVVGGPMRGQSVGSLEVPVTKGTLGIVTFAEREARQPRELPCIRCGDCLEACPWDLAPTRLVKLVRAGHMAQAVREGLARCTGCGCCSYACPSRIPLAGVLREAMARVPEAAAGARAGGSSG